MSEEVELPALRACDEEFLNLLMFDETVAGNAIEAFKRAYPDSEYSTPASLKVMASRKRNHPKIKAWIYHMRRANLDRLVCTLGEHLSELASLRDRAAKRGHYAAAINAELRRGQAAGLYIERKEIVHKKGDDLSKLVELARTGKKEIAETYAKDLGLHKDLLEALEGATMQ